MTPHGIPRLSDSRDFPAPCDHRTPVRQLPGPHGRSRGFRRGPVRARREAGGRVRGRGQRGKDAPTRPQHVRSACSQGRTQNSHSGPGSAAVRPAGIAAPNGGSARGYQWAFALQQSRLRPRMRAARPYIMQRRALRQRPHLPPIVRSRRMKGSIRSCTRAAPDLSLCRGLRLLEHGARAF